ncbi:uncharacterized protein LOC117182261 [Belonocnema kinseyi]|uniref:uncharacterized protein LOC117182261 n=1 Tax=Belonocnema kinseyi TaxID=2817044 RepID=UPI00143DD2E4|nr:uncharacterized protein LOC117182261 [Belonocnema kinseyi]
MGGSPVMFVHPAPPSSAAKSNKMRQPLPRNYIGIKYNTRIEYEDRESDFLIQLNNPRDRILAEHLYSEIRGNRFWPTSPTNPSPPQASSPPQTSSPPTSPRPLPTPSRLSSFSSSQPSLPSSSSSSSS